MTIESQIVQLIRKETKQFINEKFSNSIDTIFRDAGINKKIEGMIEKNIKEYIRSYTFRSKVSDIIEDSVRKIIFDKENMEHLISILQQRVRVRRKPIGIRINEILKENPGMERKEIKKKLLLEGYHPNYIDSALGAFYQ